MTEYLRTKLRKFLKIDTFEQQTSDELNILRLRQEGLDRRIDIKVNGLHANVEKLHTTIENVVHIGIDVYNNPNEHSWAVICIEGKMNLVKFVSLNRNDARDVLMFLKKFEGGRHCIDAPHSQLFYDQLYKL